MASSVMLLDCARLKHRKVEETFNEKLGFEQDYTPWSCLKM